MVELEVSGRRAASDARSANIDYVRCLSRNLHRRRGSVQGCHQQRYNEPQHERGSDHPGDDPLSAYSNPPILPHKRNADARAAEGRSEERSVGKEGVRTCRSRWSPYHYKKNTQTTYEQTKKQIKTIAHNEYQ